MCVHSEDDAQHELKGEKKVVEEGGGSEEEEEEGKRVSMANSECSSFSRSTSYTRTVIQKKQNKNRLQRALSLESENSFAKDAFF